MCLLQKIPVFIKEYKGQWEQGCSLYMATDLAPVRATRKKKKIPCSTGFSIDTYFEISEIGTSSNPIYFNTFLYCLL